MIQYSLEMAATEIRPLPVNVDHLPGGETLADAEITHVPPSGNPLTIEFTVDAPQIDFLLGPLAVTGQHYVKVQAEGDQGSKPEVVFAILVNI
jgi:hypothetical protein